jgi:hypothetical protein
MRSKRVVRPTPWHLWLVSLAGLTWNSYAAFVAVSVILEGDRYWNKFGLVGQPWELLSAIPLWVRMTDAIVALAVVLGCLLLLARRKAATIVLIAALAAQIISFAYRVLAMDVLEVFGNGILYIGALLLLLISAFPAYSAWLTKRGVIH